jgi:hypothetical protein
MAKLAGEVSLNDDADGSKEDTIYIDRDGTFHANDDDTNI